jgi:hypothetical protein
MAGIKQSLTLVVYELNGPHDSDWAPSSIDPPMTNLEAAFQAAFFVRAEWASRLTLLNGK